MSNNTPPPGEPQPFPPRKPPPERKPLKVKPLSHEQSVNRLQGDYIDVEYVASAPPGYKGDGAIDAEVISSNLPAEYVLPYDNRYDPTLYRYLRDQIPERESAQSPSLHDIPEEVQDFFARNPQYGRVPVRSMIPLEDWANGADAALVAPLVQMQAQLNQIQVMVEGLTDEQHDRRDFKTALFLAWLLFGLVAFGTVIWPVARLLWNTSDAVVNYTTDGPKAWFGDLFAGQYADKTGTRFNMGWDYCEITDTKRFRHEANPPRYHNGVDFGCTGKVKDSKGQEYQGTHYLYAPTQSTLTWLTPDQTAGGGLVARFTFKQDGKDMTLQYLHLHERIHPGGVVSRGDKIGIGAAPSNTPNAGTGSGPHTHLEAFVTVEGERRYLEPTTNMIRAAIGAWLPTDVGLKPLPKQKK